MANSNGTTRLKREPQPLPGRMGATAPPPERRELITEGTKPRPVTAETAYRCRLWEKGTLIYEDPWGCYEVTGFLGGLTAAVEHTDDELDPDCVDLRAEQTLTFVPSNQ